MKTWIDADLARKLAASLALLDDVTTSHGAEFHGSLVLPTVQRQRFAVEWDDDAAAHTAVQIEDRGEEEGR